jgi:nematocidal protein AidA
MQTINFEASSRDINVLVVIDTEYVKAHWPKQPNPDPAKPVGIDHNSQFMICTGSRGIISGQGTADLNFKANVGDHVGFTGVSVYDNSDDAVIVYNISYWKRDQVFNNFETTTIVRKGAVEPNPANPNGLPALHTPLNFNSLESRVKASGTEDFYVSFALYTLDDSGQNQNLYGYFYWDPTITVA